MGFIEQLLDQTQEAESPRSFFLWSGIAALSAVVKKNIWINKKIYKLYPNVYVMLVARSGLRKGFPVKLAQKLVEGLEVTKVITGRNSIQSIIQELSRQWTLESGKVLTNANGFLVNDELDSFLIDDPSAQTILTTLYDSFYHQNWVSTIKSEGRSVLKDICITMLSATNETHLNSFLDQTSVSGGFIGRTLIVHETMKSRLNPLIDDDDIVEVDYSALQAELKRVSEITGQAKLTKDAKALYKTWYLEFNKTLEENPDSDSTGLSERLHDHILKVALLLSVSDSSELLIRKAHINRSIELCTGFTINTKRVVQGQGKSEFAVKNKIFLDYMLSQEGFQVLRRRVLSAKFGDIDAIDLDKIVDTLTQAGIIETRTSSEGPVYKLTEKYSQQFKDYAEKKKAAERGERVIIQ
jgi:hypothetical protein